MVRQEVVVPEMEPIKDLGSAVNFDNKNTDGRSAYPAVSNILLEVGMRNLLSDGGHDWSCGVEEASLPRPPDAVRPKYRVCPVPCSNPMD